MRIWQFSDLKVQPGSHCKRPKWHYKSKVLVSRKMLCQNVGRSQNSMKTFFLNFQWINNVFLLVPPTVLVIIEDTSNFQVFLSLIKLIYTPLKRVSKVTYLYVGRSQNRCAYHKKNIFLCFLLHLLNYSFGPILNPSSSWYLPFFNFVWPFHNNYMAKRSISEFRVQTTPNNKDE